MTKSVDKSKSQNYMEKAENLLEIARYALDNKKYDAAVINAVHSAINALDSFTVLERGLRASGEHDDVLALIKGLLSSDEYAYIKKQFSSLLNLKNTVEYQPDFMSPKEAEDSVKWAERILGKIRSKS